MITFLLILSVSVLFINEVNCENCHVQGCPEGLCCSEYGFCGNTPAYCKDSKVLGAIKIRNGDCRVCGCLEVGNCCSPYGYCGTTPEHCANQTVDTPESLLISQTRVGDCRICQDCVQTQVCCNSTGYCADNVELCEQGLPITSNRCQPDPSKFYKIFHKNHDKYLDCKPFSSVSNASTVEQWSDSDTPNQLWQFVPVNRSTNTYLIVSLETTKALTLTSSDLVQQWSYETDNANQQMQIQSSDKEDGSCRVVNVLTEQSLDTREPSNGAPVQRSGQETTDNFVWNLIETGSVRNRYWKIYGDEKLGQICDDSKKQIFETKLSLTDCLNWCNIDARKPYCMWNYNYADGQIGFCTAVNQCESKVTIPNEKYRIYIHRVTVDVFASNTVEELPVVPTASLTNYVDYTKYLLIQANDFAIPSEPLYCTDFDPRKEVVLTFNSSDVGLRACDLCPNLPPFTKYVDHIIRGILISRVENSEFSQCFTLCVNDVRCVGYSYDEQNLTCLTFNETSMIGIHGVVYAPNWLSVLIKQPIGTIQNWLYTRNTKITNRIDEETIRVQQATTFLDCLNVCSHSPTTCLAVSYVFSTKMCQLFDAITADDYIQLSYGSITAMHFAYIYGNESHQWQFLQQDDDTTSIGSNSQTTNETKSCTLPEDKSPSQYGTYYNTDCIIGAGNGCDRDGCQLCLKSKANFEKNLPLCPSLLAAERDRREQRTQLQSCMSDCVNRSTSCIGFDFDPTISTCAYITTYSNWFPMQRNKTKRYLRTYPSGTYQFIPDCQLISSLISQAPVLNTCLKTCQPPCQKVSYNYKTLECRTGGYSTGITKTTSAADTHCFVRNLLENNDLTSIRLAFYRYIGSELRLPSLQQLHYRCQDDCSIELDQCLTSCLNSSKCQYISVTYQTANSFACTIFDSRVNDTTDFISSAASEIYYRYFDINLTQETIDQLPLFQVDTDLAQCYNETRTMNAYGQTPSTLKGYRDVLDVPESPMEQNSNKSTTRKRRRRNIFRDAIKWIGDKIVKPVVDTVVDVVETPFKIGKAIGEAISGDTEKAKETALSIGIVQDAKNLGENAIEFGKALGKGDLGAAGEALLNVGADALSFVPIPGGRLAGKVASNGIKGAVKGGKKGGKPKSNTKKDSDNKKSEDERVEQCARTRKKRAKRKDCDSNDDKQQKNAKCRKPTIPNVLNIHDCHLKSINSKCQWECDAGYIESDEDGATCKKVGKQKDPDWVSKPKCEAQSCGTGRNRYVSVETDKIVAYTVYFDTRRKLPIWSFSIHDIRNRVIKSKKANRASDFYQHPCLGLKSDQGTKPNYLNSGWDRGHLSPSDAHRYSEKASKSSNLFINVAPQDPWTNQVAWKKLEGHILCHNNKYPASLVATGICPDSIAKTHVAGGLEVPSCFWKMICYIRNGQTHVVGFLAENSRVNRKNKLQKNQTKQQIFRPVSQSEIRARLKSDPDYLQSPFDQTVYHKSNKGRTPTLVQPALCKTQMSLDKTESDAWFDNFLGIKTDKKKKKTKRLLDDIFQARGCAPSEANAMALFLGLASLDIDDTEDDDSMINEDETDQGDSDDGGTDGRPQAASCGKRVIGYYPSWGTGKISAKHIRRLTHIVYAFFEVNSAGEVFIGSADRTHSEDVQKDTDIAKKRLEHLLKLKKAYPDQKYMFAVGGWENSQYFSSIAQTAEKRLRFIASSLKLLDEYGLDGVDIDWEHPVTGGAVQGIAADKENYVLFMKEIRQALDQHGGNQRKYLLSFASAAGQWTLDPGYDLPQLLKYADFVNIMTYDFFGAWDSQWGAYTGPPAPLFFGMPPRFSGKTNVDWTVKYYVCKTNEPHKINMGVPFYGRYWKNVPSESIDPSDGMWRKATAVNGKFEGGYAPWNEIKHSWLSNPAYQQKNHEKSKSSYAFNAQEGIFLGFESPESLRDKVKYAADKNVGGLMIWAIDQDDDDLTMMNIVSSAPLCQNTNPKATFYKCSPLKDEKRWWTLEDSEEKAGMCGRSAPLYRGFYPVCDPDDPGYSCCSPEGFCGFSDKHCKSPGVNYGENPDLLVEEPVRPTINPMLWYLLDAPDGKRGRCGRDAPKLDNGAYAICNPDDKNAYCCSNGGYCGVGKEFCECEGCIDFKKQPNYRFTPKRWHDDGKCGDQAPKIENQIAICNPDSKTAYCCSNSGYCGMGSEFCDCKGCVNYKKN